jgi:hypothetical protein
MKSKCHCEHATNFHFVAVDDYQGQEHIYAQCPRCGVEAPLVKEETTPEKIAWAKAGEDVPWIGIEQERLEILPGQDEDD